MTANVRRPLSSAQGDDYDVPMKLPHPFIQLPLAFDAARLAHEISGVPTSAWMLHPQKFPGNTMLPLIAVDGDPANEAFRGVMKPTPHLERSPYLQQVIAAMGVVAGRTRLMRLAGQAEVSRHADLGYYWADRVRVHAPIITQPSVRFECGDAAVHMAAGECWIFDTWRPHRVINANDDQRIHLVVDTVGGAKFWKLVEAGRVPEDARPWSPLRIDYDPSLRPDLAFEATNMPDIMTPWELDAHLSFLLNEAGKHPRLGEVRAICGRFRRAWRALWSQYGADDAGRGAYQAALDGFLAQVKDPASQIRFANDVWLFGAIMMRIGKAAIAQSETALRYATPVEMA